MATPVEEMVSVQVGTVESVAPDHIWVLLDVEAPHSVALNGGVPTAFPRINGYVLLPCSGGAIVGLVIWLGIERSPFPKRKGLSDFGLIDLPYPLRKMRVTPVGTLSVQRGDFKLSRGVMAFPSVGDRVVLPTPEQLRVIVEANGTDRRVAIGTCPQAGDAVVSVDPNKLFGRHVAVLGNTGSGKSCSVAGLIRWSVEAAWDERRKKRPQGPSDAYAPPQGRFIVLDPNGEYESTFSGLGCRVLRVEARELNRSDQLEVPVWLWNSQEWSGFVRAAPGVQRPLLQRALRQLRVGTKMEGDSVRLTRHVLTSYRLMLAADKAEPDKVLSRFPGVIELDQRLGMLADSLRHLASKSDGELAAALATATSEVDSLRTSKHKSGVSREGKHWEKTEAYSVKEIAELESALDACLALVGGGEQVSPASEDSPLPFSPHALPAVLEELGKTYNRMELVDTLTLRVRMLLAEARIAPVVSPDGVRALADYLRTYLGREEPHVEPILILDLSLIPDSLIHTIIAVLARVVFEATQRYKQINHCELPTVLVAEEAHTFITRGSDDDQGTPSPAQMCRRVFERIAREGRKFGLGLMLSSQRPSELSQTVLAQCNTFLLHRIVNDADRELVSRLVPDNLAGMLSELPSLPQRAAILLGQATALPVRVEMKELPPSERPSSADPKFWEVWVGDEQRAVDWDSIAAAWQGHATTDSEGLSERRSDGQDVRESTLSQRDSTTPLAKSTARRRRGPSEPS